MRSICYVVPYSRCTLAKNVISRIISLKSFGMDDIEVICYDGSGADLLVSFCKENGIKIRKLSIDQFNFNLSIQNVPFLVSYEIRKILTKEKHDIVRFVDFMGSAFHCIQAKRIYGEFEDTIFAVDMYGSSQFQNEAGESWGFGGFEQLIVQYMERYCCEFCDRLTSPTQSMFEWAIKKRWILCEEKNVIHNTLITDFHISKIPDKSNLIFCGELSKAGGLHLFCSALQKLPEETLTKIKSVTFIGESSTVGNIHAEEYIYNSMTSINHSYTILNSLLPEDIIRECERLNGIIVFPQIISNNDIEFIAAIAYNIPLIAVSSASHSEIVNNSVTFTNSPEALAKKIQELEEVDFSNIKHRYDGAAQEAKWIENNNLFTHKDLEKYEAKPLVSICMAYYNHGKYLNMALSSIEALDYPNIEVILVNDGSTDVKSNEIFDKLKMEFGGVKYKFVNKENEGPSIARNYAASMAKGKYLLFMDSDNIAKPNMVSDFVKAMERSDYDCLTCYFDQFLGEGLAEDSEKGLTYTMIGPCLELGLFMNCFGDTNFIVKREVFLRLDGFYKSRIVTEDWHFLSRLCLNGYKMDVVPVPLFWYRVLPESNVSYGSEYFKQQLILETYCNGLPPYIYHAMNSLCRPALEPNKLNNIPESTDRIIKKFLSIVNKLLPLHSKRRKYIKILAITFTKSKR